ncbi:MAG: hypothetical protein E5V70_05115 [Mesorhizobium sp.]|nr:MAG: hypothetical protein E5V70_05115 [Mesorhizobium sp.]
MPEWHLAEHAVLIQHLVEPLAMLLPTLTRRTSWCSRARCFPRCMASSSFLRRPVHRTGAIDVENELLILSTPSWPASKVRVEQSGWP